MAVEEYEDGFLLSEVPLGEGILDLKQIVQTLRQKDPNMIFDLEMITRDPLKIPIHTPKYWATFDDAVSPIPGRDIAKVMALVKKNKPKKPLPKVTGLSPEAAVKLEEDYNKQCVAYAPPEPGPVRVVVGLRGPSAAPERQRDGNDVFHRALRVRQGPAGNRRPSRSRRGAPPRPHAVGLPP